MKATAKILGLLVILFLLFIVPLIYVNRTVYKNPLSVFIKKINALVKREKFKPFQVADLMPAVVRVECYFDGKTTDPNTGSGFSFYDEKKNHFIGTNAHVVWGDKDKLADNCLIYFPKRDGTYFDTVYYSNELKVYDTETVPVNGSNVYGLDFALLKIDGGLKNDKNMESPFPREFPDLFKMSSSFCHRGLPLPMGEEVYVLGYPGVGGDNMTLTNGVISGYEGDNDEWIKTSAKISYGNSGGVMVTAKDGCFLGVPSLVDYSTLDSLARVLSSKFIAEFIKNTTK